MTVLIYLLEWIVAFALTGALNFGLNKLFQKKLNPLMSAIFAFLIIGFLGFFLAPYVFTFPYPSLIYLPIAIFFFVLKIVKITKSNF